MNDNDIVEAIREGQIIKVPYWMAKEEDLFILRKKEEQTQQAKPKPEEPKITLNSAKKKANFLYRPTIDLNNHVVKQLVDNFHWILSRTRKERNISRAQVAKAVGVDEETIKNLEHGILPSDDFVLIAKIENYYRIKLRKDNLYNMDRMKIETVMPKPKEEKAEKPKSFNLADEIQIIE